MEILLKVLLEILPALINFKFIGSEFELDICLFILFKLLLICYFYFFYDTASFLDNLKNNNNNGVFFNCQSEVD